MSRNTVTVETSGRTNTVEIATQGPQGAAGASFPLVETDKVDKSIIYYDSSSGSYIADDNWTVSTLVFGGDF